jgi:starch synthase
MTRIALVSLARRGGMVHFHGELIHAISEMSPVISITAKHAPVLEYSGDVSKFFIDTGKKSWGTLLNLINPLVWYQTLRTLKECNADIFHLTSSQEWNPLLAALIRVLGKPLVFSVHDPEQHLGAPLYMRISDFLTAKISNALVVLSQLGKRQLIEKGFPAERIYHIPLGVYSFFLKNQTTVSAAREKVILFFGRIEPYKGLDILLQAFSQIANNLPDWKLIVAGAGDLSIYQPYLNHASIEVINRYIGDEEVAELMQRSGFVALPYIEATQSGVIPIAYAFGRPVVATDVGSLREMIVHEETGLLIKPGDVNELIWAMQKMTSDSMLCEQMGKRAYEMSQKEWGWEMVAQRHMNMYFDVIRKAKA